MEKTNNRDLWNHGINELIRKMYGQNLDFKTDSQKKQDGQELIVLLHYLYRISEDEQQKAYIQTIFEANADLYRRSK